MRKVQAVKTPNGSLQTGHAFVVTLLLLMLTLTSCHRDKPLEPLFIESSRFAYPTNTFLPNGTPLSKDYETAIAQLRNTIGAINDSTDNYYLKQLLCANAIAAFWYAAAPSGYLDVAHQPQDDDCLHLPLSQCYDSCMANTKTFNCNENCLLFLRLLKQELGLHAQIAESPNRHNFPVVQIGLYEFIVDPWDPVIITNTNNQLLEVSAIQKMPQSNIRIHRFPRLFGTARLLLPNSLLSVTGTQHNDIMAEADRIKHTEPLMAATFNHPLDVPDLSTMFETGQTGYPFACAIPFRKDLIKLTASMFLDVYANPYIRFLQSPIVADTATAIWDR